MVIWEYGLGWVVFLVWFVLFIFLLFIFIVVIVVDGLLLLFIIIRN